MDTVAPCFRFLYANSITLFPSILSWLCAATFAYITNRLFVFEGNVHGFGANIKQIISFYLSRLLTLGLDALILFVGIDLIGISNKWLEFCIKIGSNIIIAIINYFLGKLVVFRSNKSSR